MSLHRFMLPEVVPDPPRLGDVSDFKLPSPLFVGVDPANEEILIEEGMFRSESTEAARAHTDEGYKHWRRQYAFQAPFEDFKVRYFVDFEDACYTPREITFGRDFNVFQYNRRKGDRTSILWRLPNYFEPSRGVGHPPRGTERDEIDFNSKIPKVYWRGGISGVNWPTPFKRAKVPQLNASTISDEKVRNTYTRLNLVLSSEKSDIVDAKFAGNTIDQFVDQEIRNAPIFTDAVHANSMMEYRYLLCPAGNDVSSALYWIIRTNSVAFKEETEYETIPDYFLKPWVHYVPIAPNLQDIVEKFEFCENNPGICQNIVENAQSAYQKIINRETWEEAENTVLDRLRAYNGK